MVGRQDDELDDREFQDSWRMVSAAEVLLIIHPDHPDLGGFENENAISRTKNGRKFLKLYLYTQYLF